MTLLKTNDTASSMQPVRLDASSYTHVSGDANNSASRPLPPLPSRQQTISVEQPGLNSADTVLSQRQAPAIPSGRPRSLTAIGVQSAPTDTRTPFVPLPPPVRKVADATASTISVLPHHGSKATSDQSISVPEDDSDCEEVQDDETVKRALEMPDSTFANRRPPHILPRRGVLMRHPVHAFAICGLYAVTATSHVRLWDSYNGNSIAIINLPAEHKVTAVEKVDVEGQATPSSIIWVGTKDGTLFEVDMPNKAILRSKSGLHSHAICAIYRMPGNIVSTIDETGKIQVWSGGSVYDQVDEFTDPGVSLEVQPRTQRIVEKYNCLFAIGSQVWTAQGPHRHHHGAEARAPGVRVHELAPGMPLNPTPKTVYTPDDAGQIGAVLAGTTIAHIPDSVYFSHDSGHISIWNASTFECMSVLKISQYAITAVQGVLGYLWAGNREGIVHVYDVRYSPWRVVKAWKASDETILDIRIDFATLREVRTDHDVRRCLG